MTPIVSFIGRPNHGKTTLLEKLLPELKRQGYRIGTIKHHVHDFEMDKPGKDTWRHKKAGAHTVALSSPTGLGIIKDVGGDTPVKELVARYFSGLDLVITEGYKRENFPKIEVFRSSQDSAPLENRDQNWIALVTDMEQEGVLPHFGLNDIQGIAAFLMERLIHHGQTNRTTLMVNGTVIPLNSFVQSFIENALIGMITLLKGCQNTRDIHLTIRR